VDALARTRRSGRLPAAAANGLASDLARFPVEAVARACRIYLDHGYADENKREGYLVGIVRREAQNHGAARARRNGHGGPSVADGATEGSQAINRLLRAATRGV
jgi:hypothetical protein